MTKSAVPAFSSIDDALDDIHHGRMLVVVDDADRENEGDLVMAAEKVTPAAVNFMVTHGRGLVCAPLESAVLDRLRLEAMEPSAVADEETHFAISTDLDVEGTGVGADERAATIHHLLDPLAHPGDFRRPGHVFPLRYTPGGVLRRPGHTEAAVDLARLAGVTPAGVICEVVSDDGSMARLPELMRFADAHGLRLISIADLIAYRRRREAVVARVVDTMLPTVHGTWRILGYRSEIDGSEHLAALFGEPEGRAGVLVRVHSECLTGDVLGSLRCDCGQQLALAMERIAAEGEGVLLYVRGHEGRGVGLLRKLEAYRLQDAGCDTVDANLRLGLPVDARDYGTGASILADLGLSTLRLLTNNPGKRAALEGFGLRIAERVPLEAPMASEAEPYLRTKAARLGHQLSAFADLGTVLDEPPHAPDAKTRRE